jgi:hypothetical protein
MRFVRVACGHMFRSVMPIGQLVRQPVALFSRLCKLALNFFAEYWPLYDRIIKGVFKPVSL